ncbi:MAG: hypothetical protein LBB75_04680 [Oscillospiraceae bacterium]|nr:hypothetical protein [Oscillospiraceae bacterium]
MKRKLFSWRGTRPPVLATVALLLALGVVATTPLALTKYEANGTGSATGTVAKWSVAQGASITPAPAGALTVYRNATHISGNTSYTFGITIDSEVATDIIVKPKYYNGAGTECDDIGDGAGANSSPITSISQTAGGGTQLASTVHGTNYAWRYTPGLKNITFQINLGSASPMLDKDTKNYDRTYHKIDVVAVQVD